MKEKVTQAYQTGTKIMKRAFYLLIFFAVLVAAGYGFFRYYPYLFARTVVGVITKVEKPSSPMAFIGASADKITNNLTEKLVFAYAVAIKEASGEIVTAGSDDKQWAVAEPGKCVRAKFFPYPPWRFDKYGTYFGARLLEMHDCPEQQQ